MTWDLQPTFNLCRRRWALGTWQIVEGPSMVDPDLTGFLLLGADGRSHRLAATSPDLAQAQADRIICEEMALVAWPAC